MGGKVAGTAGKNVTFQLYIQTLLQVEAVQTRSQPSLLQILVSDFFVCKILALFVMFKNMI